MNLPLNASGYAIGRGFIPEGRPLTVDENRDAMFSSITGDYFRALQIPLLSGRTFELRDNADAPKVVIINETIAKRHFGSPAEAIGKRLSIWRDEKFMREIVGVVGDTKTGSLTGEGVAQIYVPNAQARENFMGRRFERLATRLPLLPPCDMKCRRSTRISPSTTSARWTTW